MSQDYEFKFYNPQVMISASKVADVLRGFVARGAQVVDYDINYRLHRLAPGQPFEISQAIGPDGACLVGLRLTTEIGRLGLTFQTYPQETKGAQVTLSMGGDAFEESPPSTASLLLELAKIVNLHLPAYFGWGDNELTLQRLEPALRFDRVKALAWANLFGLELVQRIGRERLAALPVHQVQTFKQGVLCLLTPLPGQQLSAKQAAQIGTQWGCVLPNQ